MIRIPSKTSNALIKKAIFPKRPGSLFILNKPKIVPDIANTKDSEIGYSGSGPKKGIITKKKHIVAKYLNIIIPPFLFVSLKMTSCNCMHDSLKKSLLNFIYYSLTEPLNLCSSNVFYLKIL